MSCTCERVFAFDLFGVDGEELRDWSPVEPTDVIVYSYPLPCGLLYHVSGIAKNVEMSSRRASTMRRRGLATSQYAEATRNLNCDEAVVWCGVGWWSGANFYF